MTNWQLNLNILIKLQWRLHYCDEKICILTIIYIYKYIYIKIMISDKLWTYCIHYQCERKLTCTRYCWPHILNCQHSATSQTHSLPSVQWCAVDFHVPCPDPYRLYCVCSRAVLHVRTLTGFTVAAHELCYMSGPSQALLWLSTSCIMPGPH